MGDSNIRGNSNRQGKRKIIADGLEAGENRFDNLNLMEKRAMLIDIIDKTVIHEYQIDGEYKIKTGEVDDDNSESFDNDQENHYNSIR